MHDSCEHPELNTKSAFILAYAACAFSGMVMGFLGGLFCGWRIWG